MSRNLGHSLKVSHPANAFGFLRLLFASLVIVSHAPELADGNRSREPLTRLFGTISFGELAVAGFFIISGYLITGSYRNTSTATSYLIKRIARIYPAFLMASLVCVVVVGPLAGGSLSSDAHYVLAAIVRALLLQGPKVADAFAGTVQAHLDGAMWTIPYEFRCYLLVMVLGMSGILAQRWLVLGMAAVLLAIGTAVPPDFNDAINGRLYHPEVWFGSMIDVGRLTGLFLSGAALYLFRDRVTYTARGMSYAALGLAVGLAHPTLVSFALASCGSYLVIGIAETASPVWMRQINSKDDISYGVYLYAWPITKLLLLYYPAMPIPVVAISTLGLAVLCGMLSWHLVEKPAMDGVRTLSWRVARLARSQ